MDDLKSISSHLPAPVLLSESYIVDVNGNPAQKTDRNGNIISYFYDYQNRLVLKQYPDLTSVTYTYDAASRMTQVSDPTGTYTLNYDNMGRLGPAVTDYAFDSASAYTVGYGYDAASNRKTMMDPQNVPTTYGYDALNRINALTYNGQTPNFTFGYDALSRRTSLTRPNGVNTSYGYDPVSRLLSVLHKLGTTTLDGANYTYDNAGNRKTRTPAPGGSALTYAYDNIYQLLSAKQGATTKESYTYDLVGNRLTSGVGTVSAYTPNTSNELVSVTNPSVSYTYDSNGNTKTKSDGTQYSWDFENRLTQVILPGAGGTVNFKYDPLGRRVQKSFVQGANTATTNYLYDGFNLLEELDGSGNLLARYTPTTKMDEQLSELRSSTTSFYQADGLGSITSLSNATGTLANTYTYGSFGNLTASSGSLINPFRYTAREFDPETGIYEYRARYFDPSVGRFISEDPIGFRAGTNFYPYVQNNPINRADPLGLKACESCTSATPLPANSPKCDSYGSETYVGTSLKCFCKCAGDSTWSQQVRGCLACEHDRGTNPFVAHQRCYRAAGAWSAPWGVISKCYQECLTQPTGPGFSGMPPI